ncbi:MAG: DUF4382 domain-containing protein [Dehalococcoidales bacterium]|jgi:hypothetical protein
MARNFDEILDECLDRIGRGESLEACLADYPGQGKKLEPLLRALLQTRQAYSFAPSAAAKRAARQRFGAALERLEQRRRQQPSVFSRLFTRPMAWVTVAAVIILVLAGYFSFSPALSPTELVANPEGNFVFLISDDVNAIADFDSVSVSISKVALILSDSGQQVEFEPEVKEVDLTLLQGDKAQEIWRGDVPAGSYTKVVIWVSDVRGVLKETGQLVEIKLPSQKLQISKPFRVTADSVTSFIYDLTVVATGNAQSGIKYILKPQVDQSGAE